MEEEFNMVVGITSSGTAKSGKKSGDQMVLVLHQPELIGIIFLVKHTFNKGKTYTLKEI